MSYAEKMKMQKHHNEIIFADIPSPIYTQSVTVFQDNALTESV